MGVSHLRRDASIATSGVANGNVHNSPRSVQVSSGSQFKRPAETTGGRGDSVPMVGAVETFDNKSVHPGNNAKRPAETLGGRAGAKNGQEKIGTKKGNNHPVSGAAMY